jgi:hypothetical protein
MKLSLQAKRKKASTPTVQPQANPSCRELLLDFLSILPNLSGKFCLFCKVHRQLPIEAHKPDCTWRLAEELIRSDKPASPAGPPLHIEEQ